MTLTANLEVDQKHLTQIKQFKVNATQNYMLVNFCLTENVMKVMKVDFFFHLCCYSDVPDS